MDINLNAKDRARLYSLAEDRNFDPVENILEKARAYDEASKLVKTSLNLSVDTDDIDLVSLVHSMLQTLREADKRIKMLNHNQKMLDDQLRKLVNVCEENGMNLGLSK